MVTIVSKNTIKLSTDASAVDNYYVGYKINLTRTDSFGKRTVQTKSIVDYAGGNKIATIDGLWDDGYHPIAGDTYDIIPLYGDGRISINPAVQSIDYISSISYGRGLDPKKDLKLDTWLSAARVCDSRSDVYVKFTGTAPDIGAVYTTQAYLWQGTVAEVDGVYIRFTNVIGKLSYKWTDWRDFKTGTLVYNKEKLYESTADGIKTAEPIHVSGIVANLQFVTAKNITKVSGVGPSTLALAVDGNPVRYQKNGLPISGYTLYDSDGIDYYRLIGWDVNEQRSVTRHQTNISIDTSLPLFDNMNSMLEHFGGILRYSGDKYILEVEEMSGSISTSTNEPRNITSDDIIGRIAISDDGIKNAYNSVTASYSDPANKFEARNISFFNSNYLKSDRNVPKKGSLTIPGITNYYNARILADKFLTKSRYGLSISMNIAPKGQLLLAGKVIQMQYPRYGWVNKKFRIENLTFNDDCTVDVVANEYDDSFYVISNISKSPSIGLASNAELTTLSSPTGLVTTNITAGNELTSAIELTWTNAADSNSPNVLTEVYASNSQYLYLNVISITGGQTFTTTENPHGLQVGQKILAETSVFGLIQDITYFVVSVSANTFTLSATYGGSILAAFTNTVIPFKVITATSIAQVPTPISTYLDTDVYSLANTRVQKYYWLRYRIDQK